MTPERFARLEQVLDRRQPDLTVVLDNVHKTHNFAAIMRTCDAVGVLEAHAVWPFSRLRPGNDISAGARKWVRVNTHPTIEAAFARLRADGMQVYAAHVSPSAVDFRALDWTVPCAVLLGAELEGISETGARLADAHVVVPMAGMTASLNVSVAASVILFEAQRQREAAGFYHAPRIDAERYRRLLFEWGYPHQAAHLRRHGLPYPELDRQGGIVPAPGR